MSLCYNYFSVTNSLFYYVRNYNDLHNIMLDVWYFISYSLFPVELVWDGVSMALLISMLLALKLDQLIRAAVRSRCNDDMIRLSPRYSQFPSVATVTCLSIEHWVQAWRHPLALCHLWLIGLLIFCWWRPFENFRLLAKGLNPGPPAQLVIDLTTARLPSCLYKNG